MDDWELIGEVGVDSGQLVVCDPCYIDSEWVRDTEAPGHDVMTLTPKGKKKFPALAAGGWSWKCFRDGIYTDPIPDLSEITMNDATKKGYCQATQKDPTGEFSYKGCCEATCAERSGQLMYKLGHAGAGVVFSSGYGDGVYQVFAKRNKEGRVIAVKIEMGDEDEED